MPLYDYKCRAKVCGHEFEEFNSVENRGKTKCPKCTKSAAIVFNAGRYHQFEEGFWTDLGPDPVHISSKKQLKAECRKRGLWAVGTLD